MKGASAHSMMPLADLNGRWETLAVRWDLDAGERPALLGGDAAGAPVHDVAACGAEGAERRMRLLVELEAVVARVHADDAQARAWLRRANANLGDRTPIEIMASSSEWIRWVLVAVGVAA